MGIRINTAIGWGMGFADFRRLCRLPGIGWDGQWFEDLEAALDPVTSIPRLRGWPLPILDDGVSALDLLAFDGVDTPDHVIIHPDADLARRWRRRDDDIDYALHRGEEASPPDDRWEELPFGHHPYRRLRMNRDGSTAPDAHPADAATPEMTGLLPGVPPTLRHWTTHVGLLDQEGVATLRPVRAVWWS